MIAFAKNSDIQKWFEAKNMPKSNSTQNDEIKQMERAINEGFAESEKFLKGMKTPFDKSSTQNNDPIINGTWGIYQRPQHWMEKVWITRIVFKLYHRVRNWIITL